MWGGFTRGLLQWAFNRFVLHLPVLPPVSRHWKACGARERAGASEVQARVPLPSLLRGLQQAQLPLSCFLTQHHLCEVLGTQHCSGHTDPSLLQAPRKGGLQPGVQVVLGPGSWLELPGTQFCSKRG